VGFEGDLELDAPDIKSARSRFLGSTAPNTVSNSVDSVDIEDIEIELFNLSTVVKHGIRRSSCCAFDKLRKHQKLGPDLLALNQ
jgi:hypothetical protein